MNVAGRDVKNESDVSEVVSRQNLGEDCRITDVPHRMGRKDINFPKAMEIQNL